MGDTTMTDTVVVITGSRPLATIPESFGDAPIIAADGALDHALAAGLAPTVLVGDLDSVGAEALAWAEANATIERHPTDKDSTDTELAVAMAADLNPARLVLLGGGDRLDHTLGAIGALGHAVVTSIPVVEAWWDGHRILVLHGPGRRTIAVEPGTTLSLLALHGEAHGVSLGGVRWPLDAATIEPLSGLGISNVATAGEVTVAVHHGVVTLVIPPAPEEPPRP